MDVEKEKVIEIIIFLFEETFFFLSFFYYSFSSQCFLTIRTKDSDNDLRIKISLIINKKKNLKREKEEITRSGKEIRIYLKLPKKTLLINEETR